MVILGNDEVRYVSKQRNFALKVAENSKVKVLEEEILVFNENEIVKY